MFVDDGFEIINNLIDEIDIKCLRNSISKFQIIGAGTRNGLSDIIIRNIGIKCYEILCEKGLLKNESSIISCIIFDKNNDKNWQVPYHRDEFFCFDSVIESDSYSEWCVKEGKIYSKPNNSILSQIVSLRIALDDNDKNNGPLKVIPGSHLLPSGSKFQIESSIDIILKSGDALVFSPLCLHASNKMVSNTQRRVLHYSWGPNVLPDGARWSLD